MSSPDQGAGSPPSYHHGNLPEALLAAAGQIIQHEGIARLTLRGVAEAVGVSHTAPYRHFKNKEELLAAFAADAFGRLSSAIRAARDASTDGNSMLRLRAGCLAYVAFAERYPAQYEVMFDKQLHQGPHPTLQARGSDAFQLLIDSLSECQHAGLVRTGKPAEQAFAIWAALHGVINLCRDQAPNVAPEATLSRATELMLKTMLDGLHAD